MKKLIASALLIIYLFNIGGHLALHQYFSSLSDQFFNEQISKGRYNVTDLTEIKIPVNMPGITEWSSYLNISGQIQFENTSYNYVKMKVTRTAVYLMCIPNYSTTRLSGDNILSAKQVKDIPVPKKNHVPYAKTTLLDKFNFAFVHFAFIAPIKSTGVKAIHFVQPLFSHTPDVPEQPPKFSC